MVGAGPNLPALTASDAQRVLTATGSLRVNSRWTLVTPPAGVSRGHEFDVDLGCLYELADGQSGVVQYLGSLRGAFEREPFVQHDRDDRAGSAAGENLFINLDRATRWRRVLVFVYAHNGPLATAQIEVDFYPSASGKGFGIPLHSIPNDAHACAAALVTSAGGRITVRREVRYVRGFQADLDRAYGFGMRWARADKPGLR